MSCPQSEGAIMVVKSNGQPHGQTVRVTLPFGVGIAMFEASATNYANAIRVRAGLGTDLADLLTALFRSEVISRCQIMAGSTLEIEIGPATLSPQRQYGRLEGFLGALAHMQDITPGSKSLAALLYAAIPRGAT